MEDKILSRISELSNKIEDLYEERNKLIARLKDIDLDIHSTSKILFELSELIKDETQDSQ